MAQQQAVPGTPARPKVGYIPTLDGWRAIAIGMVLFSHAAISPGPLQFLIPFQGYGALGVDLFFAISGLLICSRLLEEERVTGRISLRGFYIRRSFRIFPAAYLYLAVIAILALIHIIPFDWPAWASAILFVRNYFSSLHGDLIRSRSTEHFWSLGIEEHFYLLLPSLLVFFPRRRKQVLFALIVLAFLWLGIYLKITPPADRSLAWTRRTDLRIAALFFPAWIGLLIAEPAWRMRFTRWLRPSLMAAFAVLIFAAHHIGNQSIPRPPAPTAATMEPKDNSPADPSGNPANWISLAFVPLFFPLAVLSTTLHPTSLPGRMLESAPLRAVGRISFSLYIWQQLFWTPPSTEWPIAPLQRPWIAAPLVALISIASYTLVEKPFIRWGHRLAPPPSPGHSDLQLTPKP